MKIRITKELRTNLEGFFDDVQKFLKIHAGMNGNFRNDELTFQDFVNEFRCDLHAESMASSIIERINPKDE